MKPLSVAVWVLSLLHAAHAGEHVWIFSGQSNMKASMGRGRTEVRKVVEATGHSYSDIALAWSGRPISDWVGKGPGQRGDKWTEHVLPAITAAKAQGVTFAGVCWHQGESDIAWANEYADDLRDLIAMFRQATGVPELPIIVAQLNCGTYGFQHGDGSIGMLREAQRRVAEADKRVVCFGTTDCRVNDYTVHLGNTADSAGRVADRYARGAAHLAYGKPYALGPRLASVAFANPEWTTVTVTFEGVNGQLKLGDDALQGFVVTTRTILPEKLSDAPAPLHMPDLLGDLHYPTAYRVEGNTLVLGFPDVLPETAALSWAALRNADYGPVRRDVLEFDVLTDDTGVQAASFMGVRIQPHTGEAISLDAPPLPRVPPSKPQLIGLNGTKGTALLRPDVEAGLTGWRQKNWNTGSRFLSPYLKDQGGAVTDVCWSGYQHWQPRENPASDSGDEIMRFALCGMDGLFSKLPANTKVDLAVYVKMQMVPEDAPDDYVTVVVEHLTPITHPKTLEKLAALRKAGDRSKERFGVFPRETPAKPLASQPLRRAPTDAKTDNGWVLASEANGFRGNVVVFTGIDTGPLGAVRYRIDKLRKPKVDANKRRIDVAVYAAQIRIP